jgi:hypothetical protein
MTIAAPATGRSGIGSAPWLDETVVVVVLPIVSRARPAVEA